jgi:aldoxime dehydratase
MESAISKHLQCPRSQPLRASDNYVPPYPAWTARPDIAITKVVTIHLGVQWKSADYCEAGLQALREITESFKSDVGPKHYDLIQFEDAEGYSNVMAVAYWLEPDAYAKWSTSDTVISWWESEDRCNGELGYFREVMHQDVKRFETLYSSAQNMTGIGTAIDTPSDLVREHAYWGSARDRIALAQTDTLEPTGKLSFVRSSNNPKRVKVAGHHNVALIRSGQDWSATKSRERQLYLEEIEPALRAGMLFLRDSGLEIGCYVNRYVQLIDATGEPLEQSFGLSYWHSLANMEAWAETHPTHLAIFNTFNRIVQELDFNLELTLSHEVSVLTAADQDYEYINCHDRTGLLAGISG